MPQPCLYLLQGFTTDAHFEVGTTGVAVEHTDTLTLTTVGCVRDSILLLVRFFKSFVVILSIF